MKLVDPRALPLRLKGIRFDYLVILFVGILALSWFRGGLIEYLDFDLPPGKWLLSSSLFLWESSSTALGLPNYRNTASLGFGTFLYLSQAIGLPQSTEEMILFYLWFTSAGLSMRYLFSILFKEHRLAGLSAALFYMMNPYTMVYVWGQLSGFIFAYSVQPLILGLFIKGIRCRHILDSAFLLVLTWWITAGNAYGNPELFLINLLPLGAYLIAHLILHRDRVHWIRAARFSTVLSIVWAGINAYWIIPWGYFIGDAYRAAGYLQLTGSTDLGAFLGNSVPIVGAMRLLGYWAITSGYKGDPYYVWGQYYNSPTFTLLTFLLPLVAFSPLIVRPRAKSLLALASLTLLGVFLVKGGTDPGGSVLEGLLASTSLLRIFRAPYQRFGIDLLVGYSLLIGLAVGMFYRLNLSLATKNFIFRKWKLALPRAAVPLFVLSLIIGPLALPFWTGDLIYPGGAVIPSARVTIPAYYSEAAKWLASQNDDFNIMAIPLQLLGGTTLSWGNNKQGYLAINPDERLLPKPVIYTWQQYGSGLPGIIMDRLFLYNSGFETGDLTGWTVQGGTAFVQNNTVHNGKYAASVEMGPGSHTTFYLNRDFPVSTFATPLHFDVYLRSAEGEANSHLIFWFYNSSGYIGATQSSSFTDDANWTSRSSSTNPWPGADNFRIGMTFDSGPTGATVLVDDIDLSGVVKIENLPAVLSTLNVKYLVYNNDTSWNYVNGSDWWIPNVPSVALTLLGSMKGLTLEKSFDQLYFYRNTLWQSKHLWAATSAGVVKGGFDDLLTAVQGSTSGNEVMFMMSQLGQNQLQYLSSLKLTPSDTSMTFSYDQVSPVQYRIKVETSMPFFLVFSENYHKDWKAYIGEVNWISALSQSPLPDENHLMSNGFGNAWYVASTGKIIITLFFWPQETYYLGSAISISTAFLCSAIILIGFLRRRRTN